MPWYWWVVTGVSLLFNVAFLCRWLWPSFIQHRWPSLEWAFAVLRNRSRYGSRSPWKKRISQTKNDPVSLIILQELASTYNSDIKKSIEQQGSIVTTFETYSGLVSAMLRKMTKLTPPSHQVYAVTTLALPVVQWWNYGRVRLVERFGFEGKGHKTLPYQYNKTVTKWDDYLQFLIGMFSDDRTGLRQEKKSHRRRRQRRSPALFRYIVSFDRDVYENLRKSKRYWPQLLYWQRLETQAEDALCDFILCSGSNPLCIPAGEVPSKLRNVGLKDMHLSTLIDFYSTNSDPNGRTYVIVPYDAVDQSSFSATTEMPWRLVGDVFADFYQDKSKHLYLTTIDYLAFKEYYAPSSMVPVPQDFFVVGEGPPDLEPPDVFAGNGMNWVFGLSAFEPDENLEKLRLMFFSPAWPEGDTQLQNILGFCKDIASLKRGDNQSRPLLGSRPIPELLTARFRKEPAIGLAEC